MPLVGYLKSSEPGRISSITSLDGDKTRRKKIFPLTEAQSDMYVKMYVMDCHTHQPGGSVVPVILKQYTEEGWKELGVAKCCPLCWRIILQPEGVDLPAPTSPPVARLDHLGRVTSKSRKQMKQDRKNSPNPGTAYLAKIVAIAANHKRFSVYEVMDELALTRTVCLKYLKLAVKLGRIVVKSEGAGRGNRTFYGKAP